MPQRSINQFLIIFGNVGKSYPERDLVQQGATCGWHLTNKDHFQIFKSDLSYM
jgi:hypothetical protein